MIRKFLFVLFFSFMLGASLKSQDGKPSQLSFSGYISDMQSSVFQNINEQWISDNTLHNRLNFHWYPTNTLSASIQLRNRFVWGETIGLDSTYASGIDADNGLVDLSANVFNEQSFLLNTVIDRLWFAYEKGKLSIKLGRQRINWGQNYVWNPNDIFNVYSFFDVDYIERPGSDALRIQYYLGMASSVELAAKIDNNEDVTAAMLFRFNKWNFDFQVLGGLMDSEDMVIGGGWTGNIGGAGISGEFSYFYPVENKDDTEDLFMASIGSNYTFANSLMLQFEFLYSDMSDDVNISNFTEFYSGSLSVKNISFTPVTLFGNFSYPITPLLNISTSAMCYPKITGFAIIPTITCSIADNLDFDLIYQGFSGEFEDETGEKGRQNYNLVYLRFKLNF